MALQYAFRLGTFAFAVTLIRAAMESTSFENGLKDSILVAIAFFGIGFALGKVGRHIVEELAERELSLAQLPAETGVMETESNAPTIGS